MRHKKVVYEYGNSGLWRPLHRRVEELKNKLQRNYDIVSMKEQWTPSKYVGKNASGVDIYLPEKCKITIIYKTSTVRNLY